MHRRFALLTILLWLAVLGLGSWPAHAQLDALTGKFQGGGADSAKLSVRAVVEPVPGGRGARLVITGQVAPTWHIYSITQPPGGPIRSKIKIPPSNDYRVGEFTANPAADVHEYADIWPGLKVEEHVGKVTWTAPIEFAAGVDPAKVDLAGSVYAQICADSCLPPRDYKFVTTIAPGVTATDAGRPPTPAKAVAQTNPAAQSSGAPPVVAPPAVAAHVEQPPASEVLSAAHATLRGKIEPATVAPGGQAQLVLTAEPKSPYYLYALADRDFEEPGSPKPTLIEFDPSPALTFGRPVASAEPASKKFDGRPILYHGKAVNWTTTVTVPADTQPGDYPISGMIGFMTCQDGSCDLPTAAHFSATLRVSPAGGAVAPLRFLPGKYEQARRLAEARASIGGVAQTAEGRAPLVLGAAGDRQYEVIEVNGVRPTSLPMILLFGFVGGLILNVMPCVLPVIGLKILSFVEQGGQSPGRILLLNVIYSAGMMAVFLILATLAVTLNLSWGQHFNSLPFTIGLTTLVFAMALSFLGVWEIPIPGFVGSGASAKAIAREGVGGAFAKGVITTILATPCSGPYLGAVFGFTVGQPPMITYLVFATIGLGMASPYLVIGAFPRLVKFLPKPGAWMDLFKQLMGFVLLGTVVFLFRIIDRDYLVPTFALLVGVWLACWWIGRAPIFQPPLRKLLTWLEASVVAVVVGSFAFTWLIPHPNILPWQPFSRGALAQLTSEGKTVLVDFTANWCLTCQFNLKNAIDTEAVRELIEANGVVPLLADWRDDEDSSNEFQAMLHELNSNDIPLLAVFPAGQPNKAYVLRAIISQHQLLDVLAQAGPSRGGKAQASAVDHSPSTEPGSARR
jgi:suppressor for copper-sensitivity B